MTEFKVGDRVKLSGEYGGWFSGNEGKTGTITRITHEWTYVTFDNSKGETFEDDYGNPELLELISRAPETPPATIQHEGYNYTRGEPVVPEWVKDGAWVINKENGELNQLIAGDPGYFRAVNKKTWHAFVLDFHPSMSVSDVFRPFTNADWKWGMWAEYKGEKVFVTKVYTVGAVISTPKEEHLTVLFSELTPTTAP